ncbi:DUF1963 domain-containing protein [Dactylosporangium sp. CA-152071]|uniref:DUF1963 domain-containing protein n=1 Tax=Dactylosporangium sp. CA-152071 TaxID=3239933 RepID=UPI003D9499B8
MEVDEAELAALYTTLDADVAAAVASFELPSVRIQPTEACDADAAVTRFGGVPLVGMGFAWPTKDDGRPLSLIGQWRCDELNRWIGEQLLPADSLLCFFFDVEEEAGWGLTPQDVRGWRVTVHRAFGWPEPQQNPMHLDCQLVSNGRELTAAGYRDPRVPDLQADAAGWQLLWQVDTDLHGLGIEWMWGDMGKLYFWIRSEDLAIGRFDRVWVLLQG